jgi:hypothetical protein
VLFPAFFPELSSSSEVTKDRYIKAFDSAAVLAAMKKLEVTLDAMSQSAPIDTK